MVGRRDDDDIALGNDIYLASPARALIDNSHDHPGRPNQRIVRLSREELHDQIVRFVQTTRRDRVENLLAQVVARSPKAVGTGIKAFFDAALAKVNTVDSPSRAMRAAQRGEGYDPVRVSLFREVAEGMACKSPVERKDIVPAESAVVPFFEAYFSNFIEGTEFTVKEAEAIIYDGADSSGDQRTLTTSWEPTRSPPRRA